MAGAKGIMDAVLGNARAGTGPQTVLRPDNAQSRLGLVSEMAEGNLKNRLQRLVDPRLCRIWSGNARRYELLNQTDCQDLINGLLAQGKQEFPAIVRPVASGEGVEYEVICGARRHWAVSWLRANTYPEYKFLIEVRDMSDEEAFRLSDIENRDRTDVSDYERARTYLAALALHYGGHQGQMAKRLEVTETWLSRYLALARLPEEIVACFSDVRDIGIAVAAKLAPLLNQPPAARAMLAAARQLRTGQGAAPRPAVDVTRTLMEAARPPRPAKRSKAPAIYTRADGRKLVEIRRVDSKTADVRLYLGDDNDLAEALSTIASHLQSR